MDAMDLFGDEKYIKLELCETFVCRHDYYHCSEKVYRVGKHYRTLIVDSDIVLRTDNERLFFKSISEKMYYETFCTDIEYEKKN